MSCFTTTCEKFCQLQEYYWDDPFAPLLSSCGSILKASCDYIIKTEETNLILIVLLLVYVIVNILGFIILKKRTKNCECCCCEQDA